MEGGEPFQIASPFWAVAYTDTPLPTQSGQRLRQEAVNRELWL